MPSDATWSGGRGTTFHPQHPPAVRVSAGGDTVTAWVPSLSPGGVYIWVRDGDPYKGYHEHDSWGQLRPGPDGRTVYAVGRIMTSEGKTLAGGSRIAITLASTTYLPAAQGPFYLSIAGIDIFNPVKPTFRPMVHVDRDTQPLVSLPELTGMDSLGDRFGRGETRDLDQRLFLIADAKLLAILPEAADKLILHRFDLDAMLDKASIDYLFMTGQLPPTVARGATFSYAPTIRSKKGGVKVRVESGPDRMKVTADGKVTWPVPTAGSDKEVNVLLSVTDASGQETLHAFKLLIRDDP